jgi:two-component sensor histidine kinase
VHDIADLERAEAALLQSQERLSAVLESVTDGFFALDADWRITMFNRACEQAFGVARADVIGRVVWDVFPAMRDPAFAAWLRSAEAGPAALQADSILEPGGRAVFRAVPKTGGGIAIAFSDITQRLRAEEHRQILVNELNHRVKNTLSVVQSIAAQSFKPGVGLASAREAFEGRLATLAAAHTLLTAQNWGDALISDVLEEAVLVGAERCRFTLSGPPVALPPQTAVLLALAVHELCTNAARHGALSVAGGRVRVRWAVATDDEGCPRLRLLWRESGGPPVRPPTTRGFGARLLQQGLARELGGSVTLDFEVEGLTCNIDMPLPELG